MPLAERLSPHEKLFTKIALQKRLIDRHRLDDCVERHSEDALHIGLVLFQEGLLETEALVRICRTMQKYVQKEEYAEEFEREDEYLTTLAVEKGLLDEAQVAEGRELQVKMAGKGVPYSLGWILVQRGHLAPEDYLALLKHDDGSALAIEEKIQVTCETCGAGFRVRPKARKGKFNCPRCRSIVLVESAAHAGTEDPTLDAGRPETRIKRSRATIDTAEARNFGGRSTAPPVDDGAFDKNNFAGDYEIAGEIARGGMGIVYKARQKSLDRIVAIKILKEGANASKASIKRFIREAQAAAKLDHPAIVAIHQVSDQTPYFFSMAYIEGDSLDQLIRKKRLPLRRGVEMLEQVARGVHYAHLAGVVHRDLKPGNILVDKDGTPKITDFGLAKSVDFKGRLTQSGYAIGTPYYMSPEQARGDLERIGPRSDVYNMGVILYEMCCGRVPFMGRSNVEIYEKIRHEEPRPPRELNNQVPRDLQTICLKAMEKESARRYKSALDMAEDIRRYLDGQPIEARPIGFGVRFLKRIQRNKTTAAVAGLAAVIISVLSVVIVGLYLEQGQAVEDRTRVGEELIVEGDRALLAYDLGVAFERFDRALRTDDQSPAALLGRGKVYYYQRSLENARLDLTRAVESDPMKAEPYFFLGATQLRLGDAVRAIDSLTAAVDRATGSDPASLSVRARAHFYRAAAFARVEDHEAALSEVQNALRAHAELVRAGPTNGPWPGVETTYFQAVLLRGQILLARGEHDRAIEVFEQAIEVRPRSMEAHLHEALAQWRAARYEVSLRQLMQMIDVRSDYDGEAPPGFVVEIMDGGDLDLAGLRSVIEPPAWSRERILGDLPDPKENQFVQLMKTQAMFSKMGDYVEIQLPKMAYFYYRGQRDLTSVILESLSFLDLLSGAMSVWGKMMGGGQPEPAADGVSRSHAIYGFIALAQIESGNLDEAGKALDNLEKVQAVEDEMGREVRVGKAFEMFVRGRLAQARGEHAEAVLHYQDALAIEPAWSRLHVLMGLSYLSDYGRGGGRDRHALESARTELETALRKDPDRFEAAYFLGRMARDRGDLQTAAIWWNRALEKEPRLLALRRELESFGSE